MNTLIGRAREAQALVETILKDRSVALVGPPGAGKTALLEAVRPELEPHRPVLWAGRLAPHSALLAELFEGLRSRGLLEGPGAAALHAAGPAEARRAWGRAHPTNDAKARDVLCALRAIGRERPAVVIVDDASGLTPGAVPWLVALEVACTLVLAVDERPLKKPGTGRLWARLEAVRLGPLPRREAAELLDALLTRHGVVAEAPAAYRARVLALAAGHPGTLARLAEHGAGEAVVRGGDLIGLGERHAGGEERGVALGPVLLALGALSIAWRYVSQARGDNDGYVIAGVLIAVFTLARLMGGSLRPRRMS